MQYFLRKVNDKFEYKQYLPNKTIKKKGDTKSINPKIYEIKEYLFHKGDNKEYAEKISKSRHLYYSKKLHGDRMLKSIVPEIVGDRCRHYFRPTYLELVDLVIEKN